MSNKTQLQTNNTTLDGYIARINAAKDVAASLPEAGGSGGSVEAWSGVIQSDGPGGMFASALTVYYTDSSMNTKTESISTRTEIEVAANTIVVVSGSATQATSGCTRVGGGMGSYAYQITANNFIITATM